jgi:hypothetical protein
MDIIPNERATGLHWMEFGKFQNHSGMMVKRKISSTLHTIAYTSYSICSQLYNSQTEEVGKYSHCSTEKITHLILLNSFIQNRDSFLNISLYLSKKNKY